MSDRIQTVFRRAAVRAALEAVALAAILALAAYLRFAQLPSNPGWYSDEGTLADIARHLSEGRLQYQALTESTLVVARFPVMPSLVALLMPAGGDALATLRSITAGLGVISTAAVYALMRRVAGGRSAGLALLAAAMFALYPPAVFYSRVGFSYNLLAPLVMLAAIGLWDYLERGRPGGALLAALALGIGTVTDLMAVSVLIAAVVLILSRDGRALLWWLPLALAPLAVYVASIGLRDPEVLAADLRFIFGLMSAVPWWAQLSLIVLNIGTLMLTEVWWIPGLLGLLLLRTERLRFRLLALLLIPLVLLGRTAGLAGLRLYSISPLFPFIAIGVANLLWVGAPWLAAWSRKAALEQSRKFAWLNQSARGRWIGMRLSVWASAAVVFVLALSPLLISTLQLFGEVQAGFRRGDFWAYIPAAPAREAAEFLNRRTGADDLVLASPAIAWALDSQAADFQQLLAYSGVASVDYPASLPHSRFAFEVSADRADYAVLDPIWREWGAPHMLAVEQLIDELEQWPIVWHERGIEVRQNPDR